MDNQSVEKVPALSLAFVGDAVYALYVRRHLTEKHPYMKPDRLHQMANKLVSARAQADALHYLKHAGVLSEKEWNTAKKARNKSSATRAKNATIKEYRNASGLEALIGYLDLTGESERIDELMKMIIEYGSDVE